MQNLFRSNVETLLYMAQKLGAKSAARNVHGIYVDMATTFRSGTVLNVKCQDRTDGSNVIHNSSHNNSRYN